MGELKNIRTEDEAREILQSYKAKKNEGGAQFAISYIMDGLDGIGSNKLNVPAAKFVVRAVESAYCSLLLDRELLGRQGRDSRVVKEVSQTLKLVYGYYNPEKGDKALEEDIRKLWNKVRSSPLIVETFGKQKIV